MDRAMTVVPAEELLRLAGPTTFSRGRTYVEQGRVLRAIWRGIDQELVGDVAGSSGLYSTTILFEDYDDGAPGEVIGTSCSCPVGSECKHCVALLLFNNASILRTEGPAGLRHDGRADQPLRGRQATPPAWKQFFDRIVDASRPASVVSATPLALGFELHRPPSRRYRQGRASSRLKAAEIADEPEPQLHIRPLVPGAKGNWIKGQAGWHWFTTRMRAAGFDSDQFEWFFRLATLDDTLGFRGYSSAAATIVLDDLTSPFLWDLLTEANEHDIPLIGADKQITVRLADAASYSIDITQPDEDLLVSPEVSVDGEAVPIESVRPIGSNGIYSLSPIGKTQAAITLAPLNTRLTPGQKAMLASASATEIPSEGHHAFFDRILPLLRPPADHGADDGIVSSDGSVDLPVVRRPHLDLRITYGSDVQEQGDGNRSSATGSPPTEARLEWSWTYYSPQRTCSLIPLQSEFADPVRGRDATLEKTVLSQVRAIDPNAARSESVTLTGIDVATFSARILPQLEALDDVEVTIAEADRAPNFRELEAAPSISLRTQASDDADWFDLGIEVSIDGHAIPFVSLFKALATEQTHLLLEDGSFFSLDHSAFDRLRELLAEAASLDGFTPEEPQLSRYQAALYDDLEKLADDVVEAPGWSALMDGLRQVETVTEAAVPETVCAQLRPYQVEGFRWLAFLHEHGLGGILADDMGLGKTLQTLALIDHDRRMRRAEQTDKTLATGSAEAAPPFLVIAPTSVVANWVLEARRFTPHLNVTSVTATAKKRGSCLAEAAAGADIVITSYAVMRLDVEEFAGLDWAGAIFDEAQFMKNSQAKTHRAARRITAPFRLAITGTPMENSLTDVWALAAITAPGLFPSAKQFKAEYVKPIESGADPERMTRLRSRLRPFMLRRTKDLVAADLPAKQEQVVSVELEPQHRRLYDTVLQRERKQVLGLLGDFEKNRFAIFRSLTLLRMLALDPSIIAEYADSGIGSSKLNALMEHLSEITAEDHRALVFSQFTSYLHAVAAALEAGGIDYVYLDGSTKDRAKVIESFREGDAPVFLISLKAGGFGLTLTEADYVFLLDPWWNPAAESQAIDRTHRIGQNRNVMVYRLVAENTIEEKVLALQEKKAELFTALMDGGSAFSDVISAADIRDLLER